MLTAGGKRRAEEAPFGSARRSTDCITRTNMLSASLTLTLARSLALLYPLELLTLEHRLCTSPLSLPLKRP